MLAEASNDMANSIKQPSDGLALQITRPARQAGFVGEDSEGTATYLATIRIHAVGGVLIAIDVDGVSDEAEAEIVVAAIEDTGSAYTSIDTRRPDPKRRITAVEFESIVFEPLGRRCNRSQLRPTDEIAHSVICPPRLSLNRVCWLA
ncbi:hypothetical protein [Halobacterium salinarum]|nr:hypothetical protein [Halobacterium salinarum]